MGQRGCRERRSTQRRPAWLDEPASNFGWLLRGNEDASPTAKRFHSRQSANPPTLVVTYTPNRPPVALTQSKPTAEDTPVGITLTGSDVDGDTLTFAIVTGPANGTLSGIPPMLTYTPAANFNSTDSFTFSVSDGILTSPPATVSLPVTSVNDPPLANDDMAGTLVATAVTIDVLSNDSDIDKDTLSVSAVTQGANGTVVNNTTNVTYTPRANFKWPRHLHLHAQRREAHSSSRDGYDQCLRHAQCKASGGERRPEDTGGHCRHH